MKLKNKVLSAFMAIAASMTFVTISALAADPSITITADKDSVKAGEDITITVAIANNPGVTAFNAEVDADDSLTLASTGAVDAKLFKGSYLYVGSLNPYQLNWNDGTATENNTANGTIATMTYTVSADATPGTYPITITSDPGNTMNLDWDEIDFGTATYNVTVAGNEPETVNNYFSANFTAGGQKYNANKGMTFFFNSKAANKDAEYTWSFADMFGETVFEAETDVTVEIEVANAPAADDVTLTGYAWAE